MTNTIFPVTRERHGRHAWNKAAGFGFARQEQVVPVALQEATALMMNLPLGFLLQDGKYQFMALLGLRPGENLWVGGDGAGVSRGIVGAAASGIIAARGIKAGLVRNLG